MEKAGFKHLCELLGDSDQAKEMYSLWEEYEECATPEALLVKDLDKFEVSTIGA